MKTAMQETIEHCDDDESTVRRLLIVNGVFADTVEFSLAGAPSRWLFGV